MGMGRVNKELIKVEAEEQTHEHSFHYPLCLTIYH